jgi:polyhydroxyalkanoate synthesis regulator protein
MRAAFGENPAVSNFETMARSNMEWFEQAMRMFSPFGAAAAGGVGGGGRAPEQPAAPEAPSAEKSEPDRSQDLDQLQRQLGEMQAQLERLTRGKG